MKPPKRCYKTGLPRTSWHIQRDTPLHILKELGGWETLEMVQRYAHLSADHLTQWIQPLSNLSCNLAAQK